LDQTLVHSYPGDGRGHLAVTAATLAGVALTVVHRRHRWLAVSFLLGVGLAALAAGPVDHPLRWLASFWYTQAGRIAPVAVVPAVLLAGYALTGLADRARLNVPGRVAGAAALAAVLAVPLGTAAARLPLQARVVASAYVPGELAGGTMATSAGLAMMGRLADTRPPDAVVVGDPSTARRCCPRWPAWTSSSPSWAPAGSPPPTGCCRSVSPPSTTTRRCARPWQRWGPPTSTRTPPPPTTAPRWTTAPPACVTSTSPPGSRVSTPPGTPPSTASRRAGRARSVSCAGRGGPGGSAVRLEGVPFE